jgi:hypothetical protein
VTIPGEEDVHQQAPARIPGESNHMSDQTEFPSHDDIASLARRFWEEEGQPEGKAEEHWQRAEQQLRQPQSAQDQAQGQPA